MKRLKEFFLPFWNRLTKGVDKELHRLVGSQVSFIVVLSFVVLLEINYITDPYFDIWSAYVLAFIASLAVGLGGEVKDKYIDRDKGDWYDVFATAHGGIYGLLKFTVLYLIYSILF